jgi:hypothetical protein
MEELEYFKSFPLNYYEHMNPEKARLANAPGMVWLGAPGRDVVSEHGGKSYTFWTVDVIRNPDPALAYLPRSEYPLSSLSLLSEYMPVPVFDRCILNSSITRDDVASYDGIPGTSLTTGGILFGEPHYTFRFLYDSMSLAGFYYDQVYTVEQWIKPGKIAKFKGVKGYWYAHPNLFTPVE